jgi:hypothetical protein
VVVVHPHCINDPSLWRAFQQLLCIENMDTRKSTGRTLEELGRIFNQFPAASLCFDIAHAYQVNTAMTEAFRTLRAFRHRIVQLHIIEVTSSGKHARISDSAVRAYREVVHYLPHDVPVILETPVTRDQTSQEIRQTERVFEAARLATVGLSLFQTSRAAESAERLRVATTHRPKISSAAIHRPVGRIRSTAHRTSEADELEVLAAAGNTI